MQTFASCKRERERERGKERERERKREGEGEIEREKENVCLIERESGKKPTHSSSHL